MNYKALTSGSNSKAIFIAEAGINHDGSFKKAKEMVDAAVKAKADYVKFQSFKANKLVTPDALTSTYIDKGSYDNETFKDLLRRLELDQGEQSALKDYCDGKNIHFLSTAFDTESFDFLLSLGMDTIKVASGDLTNIPLLIHTAKKHKPMILSTGMADMEMVETAVNAIKPYVVPLCLLQCTSTYPSVFEEVNLSVINTFKQSFPHAVIGYSGHELGIAITEAAVALGAKIVERHFTLDRTMKGGDHAASLEPGGFSKLVRDIRHIEAAMGVKTKRIQDSEAPIFKKLAKSIVSPSY